jgi:hypothetical protein
LHQERITNEESGTFIVMNMDNDFLTRPFHTAREELILTKPVVINPLHKPCEQVVNNPVETIVADAWRVPKVQLAY